MVKRIAGDTDGENRRGRKAASASETWNAAFRGYLNYTPTDPERSNFEAWCESASLWDVLQASVEDGVHLTLKWDAKQSTYLASGTQRREGSPNAGLVVTARASEAWKAFARLLFSLARLGQSARWEDVQPMTNPDRW